MVKAEQIPDAVVAAYEDGRWNLDLSVAESLAHALNAWPGMWEAVNGAVILPRILRRRRANE